MVKALFIRPSNNLNTLLYIRRQHLTYNMQHKFVYSLSISYTFLTVAKC